MLLKWKAPVISGIAGYRVYRSDTYGEPFELIGLSWSPVFEDWVSPRRGQTFYYVVTAYDQAGGAAGQQCRSQCRAMGMAAGLLAGGAQVNQRGVSSVHTKEVKLKVVR